MCTPVYREGAGPGVQGRGWSTTTRAEAPLDWEVSIYGASGRDRSPQTEKVPKTVRGQGMRLEKTPVCPARHGLGRALTA